ncbi:MAG: X-Pro aminopeptidase [Flavobacteriaceae bacterium]|nr:X-Pro aminopeptidase [Flavobacteriaceae bacterium]|tara:strand:- start:18600 stop:19892 length:1293 start_codon:yes stop_codon:yes gene_type:complete
MRYKPINSSVYKNNRKSFSNEIDNLGLAVFNSNDIYPVSADTTLPFSQHRDIFYLSGIDQEETILILFPNAKKTIDKEILFIKQTNKQIAIWEGEKLSKEKARKISGIENVKWISDFKNTFFDLASEAEILYFNTNEHYRAKNETQTREDRFIQWAKNKYPAHKVGKSNPILQKLRSIKSVEEINQIKKACEITEKGFRRIINFIEPGVWEYEIEAELIHEFIRNKSKGFAYSPIIASGKNANILHYESNNQKCKSGDLVLLDVAAEYGNYSSDLTRTLPVSGRYTDRQKKVYNSVLNVKNLATKMLQPGVLLNDYHKEVGEIMTSELLKLGLLKKIDIRNQNSNNPAYKKYFMHGTSHHMGLDTHDYGLLSDSLVPNMVLTVEPGIYIPEEGFGIRLEDDVVIQEKGEPTNLMEKIPIEIEEIEMLMNR